MKPSELLHSLMRDMDFNFSLYGKRFCISSNRFIELLDVEYRITRGKELDRNQTYFGFHLIAREELDDMLQAMHNVGVILTVSLSGNNTHMLSNIFYKIR